jgi:hypothetical protein
MALRQWYAGTSCALVFAAMVGPAHSDPLAGAATFIKSAVTTAGSGSEQVAYRICTADGVCRWVNVYGPGIYGYTAPGVAIAPGAPVVLFGYRNQWRPTDPDAYRVGTRRWWQGMDRFDRGGTQN